jgi:hypothetical protein
MADDAAAWGSRPLVWVTRRVVAVRNLSACLDRQFSVLLRVA